ncbi:Adaptor protein complex 3 (AP-3), mu subunitA [Monocercomonoides exilis]|uniref:Adaptor protein complex 3 (AP-3), mu subunitA n=1 Tax=Monocercomonoides exilis TaxID=2049356 RepID=UPI00355A36EC|nr:Adaptor protein complex 3 (AP-3), mu subunitA [Monocercomonoides exilis]|eukprot:MONOS_5129.1-p1 / transcript=MONOS_5129.1 / gene=MONOS_5129 / organism=Monocercomonoides_exilis_PA203 / gene_product= Adaptor protein complex 3 (AP-3), mu subunit A / transcript_product= Adaptor protein complex 3 (AP-3), mu subunit A / location=Mono_scaffold00146:16527-19328(-) / protein_length=418 / sequence_SO=supercontig / SO=protein_coding / is_pseudo=false
MIDSFYICSGQGDLIFERSYGEAYPRSLCDDFFLTVTKTDEKVPMKPMIYSEQHDCFLFYYQQHNLVYMIATKTEAPALLFSKFLEHVDRVLCDFFGEKAVDQKVRQNFIYLFMLMEELIDGGYPNITEPNLIKEMLETPGFTGYSAGTVISNPKLPDSMSSPMYWRKSKVVYVQNEVFIDINETFNASFGSEGVIQNSHISGEIQCTAKLSGVPDLTMQFENPSIMDDVSLHPCVRYFRWNQSKVVSFVPPDGMFTLLRYRAGATSAAVPPPISVRPEFLVQTGSARFFLGVAARNTRSLPVEDCYIDFKMPRCIKSCGASCSVGGFTYDVSTHLGRWVVNRLPLTGEITIQGTMDFEDKDTICEERPIACLHFKIPNFTASSLKLTKLDLSPDTTYKMYKGLKTLTLSGNYEVRF